MRYWLSNILVSILALIGLVAKFGGLVMDVLGLPEAGKRLAELLNYLGINGSSIFLIVASIVLLIIINWSHIQSRLLKQNYSRDKITNNYEVDKIRRDIYWLKENLSDYTPYDFIEKEAHERRNSLDNSDALIWTDEKLNQLRRDFINSVNWMMHCQKTFGSADEDKKTREFVITTWRLLDKELARCGTKNGTR